ncbi:PREDICTED: endonuclease 8-like 3 [Miniopterus natalensis]|uniref:endonuclease 8-like 3 n=1 Tax=Miniopterus natalensis TaxID=291302 RepID=UPI0007A6BAFA|nr:PREDICTED: endonuclease 8-like 3 [Miniopterus natalensis]
MDIMSYISQQATAGNSREPSAHSWGPLNGQVYGGVETLGKELFLYFGPKALRVHFGMRGSVMVNPPECRNKSGVSPVLEIQLSQDSICFLDSSVELRNSAESQQRVRMMEELDVCSPKFSFSRAEREVKRQPGRMLCDVLMDQRVLPGVGNIIRNEALSDSGLHPALKVSQLTGEQIHQLVERTRDFSLLFYRCRKAGLAVSTHFKVYKRPNCGRCGCQVTVCRLGENNRMTYFCPQCQREDPHRADESKLPARNTDYSRTSSRREHPLDDVATKCEEPWACSACTLINAPSSQACDACLAARPAGTAELGLGIHSFSKRLNYSMSDPVPKMEGNPAAFSSRLRFPCNSFGKPSTDLKVNRKTAFGTTTLILTDFSNKSRPSERTKSPNRRIPDGRFRNSPPSAACLSGRPRPSEGAGSTARPPDGEGPPRTACPQPARLSPACGKPGTARCSPPGPRSRSPGPPNSHSVRLLDKILSMSSQRSSLEQVSTRRIITVCLSSCWIISEPQVNRTDGACVAAGSPRCGKHHLPCALRTVSKAGENRGRRFYACPLPRGAQCLFFEWADLSFPLCDHGKRCLVRTVLKMGPNNRKRFFVCPLAKEKQCSFFQWAASEPGVDVTPGR